MKLIDFKREPVNLTPYDFGEDITRENFGSFLALSYELSQGKFSIQKVFFAINKIKFGFCYEQVIREFCESGGYDIFTENEKEIFQLDFLFTFHNFKKLTKTELEDTIRSKINGLYEGITTEGIFSLDDMLKHFNPDEIESISDFEEKVEIFNEARILLN